MKNPFKPVFLNKRLYQMVWGLSALFIVSYLWHVLYFPAMVSLMLLVVMVAIDLFMLFGPGTANKLTATRFLPERFSNGDANSVSIEIESSFNFPVNVEIIDELPFVFQIRDSLFKRKLVPGKSETITYQLFPVERGSYRFGVLNVYATARLGLVSRRYRFGEEDDIKVYPSFVQMRRYELMAISNRLSEMGVKKIRRVGHHMEFDQIRGYIKGDDVRTINWKATARKGHLMVNQYQDEKSQQVFCVIDMGRTMKMPFHGMTLLDYAINTSLVVSNIAMLKHDRAGLITFNEDVRAMLPARREGHHLQSIMEVLYNQQTGFLEHNLEALYGHVRHRIHQRSLLILFTNFESLKSAKREIPLLSRLAANHLLLVVFFENSEIAKLIRNNATNTEDIYMQAVAEKFLFEKKQIVKEFERFGIPALLTRPEQLTIDTMNRYLEFKARGAI